MSTRLVNVTYDKCDVYIGRGSPFGNPFVIGVDGDRAEVIRKYSIHLQERLKIEPAFEKQLLRLAGKTLGCHCAPMACHGQVLVEWLEVKARACDSC